MCGIVGILGKNEVAPLLVEALKRLEYRGYDSAGIATLNNGILDRRRAVGKLVNLSDVLVHDPLQGKAGIGHTRWATHGAPSVANAHPHNTARVSVVHNGIIENFKELRQELAAKGIKTQTDTDTETIVLLAQDYIDQGQSPIDAARATIAKLTGAYALCFLFEGEEDLLIASRCGAPLAIGHGDSEMFVGSDAIALSPMTSLITYLEDGDTAIISRESAIIFDAQGQRTNREARHVVLDQTRFEKGGHRHFMAKEIAEQPSVIDKAITHYLDDAPQNLEHVMKALKQSDRITLVACGTAYYACLVARYWFEALAGIPVDLDIGSEFRYREPPVSDRSAAIFVSQSGETADTLAALRYCQGNVATTIAVTNAAESSIARECDIALPILAGVEMGVASTKAFTCQLTVLLILAIEAAHARGKMTQETKESTLTDLRRLPGLIQNALGIEDVCKSLGKLLGEAQDIIFLGRGNMFPLALEGALKLKEVSYIHAEGYAAGELKHGPIALIDKQVPVVIMAPIDPLFEKTVSNMQEVVAREGRVVLISDANGLDQAGDAAWQHLKMPKVNPIFAPILYAIPAQLLAYYTAIAKGTDVDQPRNLAKSVTVE